MRIYIKHYKNSALSEGMNSIAKTTLAQYDIESYDESLLVSSEGLYLITPSKYEGTMRVDITDGPVHEDVIDGIVIIKDESLMRWRLATKLPYSYHRMERKHICIHYKNSPIPSSLHAIYEDGIPGESGENPHILKELYLEYEFMPKDIKEELKKFTLLIS